MNQNRGGWQLNRKKKDANGVRIDSAITTDDEEKAILGYIQTRGVGGGVHSIYQRMRSDFETATPAILQSNFANLDFYPSMRDVANVIREQPSIQEDRPTRVDGGPDKLGIKPVLPRRALQFVGLDTMMMPRSFDLSKKKVDRAIIVHIDALTKFITLDAIHQKQGTQQAEQTRIATEHFLRLARTE